MPRVPEIVRKVKVDALALDLNNYRFANEQPDESMAFNYLFENEEAMAVATSLLREGYTTNEVPLVVEERGRYVVLEANRRVSALRALRDPSLVPSHRRALETLVRRYQADADDLPDEIYVTIYPDRATAAPVLAREHIGEDKKRWGLDEQAKFVLAQLAAGADVKTLKQTLTGINDVVRLARMGHVRQALHATAFTDPTVARYAKGTDLKMSAFEYAYKDRAIRPLLGFEFDDEGRVIARPQTAHQVAVLERVLSGFRSGELSTRKVLNDKAGKQYALLLEELRALAGVAGSSAPVVSGGAPTPGPAGTVPGAAAPPAATGAVLTGGAPPTGGPAAASPIAGTTSSGGPVGPNSPDTKRRLVVTVDYSKMPAGLVKRFIELRSIDIVTHPSAAAMLMRSVVESSVKQHYSARNNFAVQGMLGQVVPTLAKDYGKLPPVARAIQLLGDALAPQARPGSGRWFNSASHDPTVVIDDQQIRDAWQELETLVRFLLQPPATT